MRIGKTALGLLLLLLSGPLYTLASGSVEFGELEPLFQNRPDLVRALELIEFYRVGSATRIGHKICPALAGERVGPYFFQAWEKSVAPGGGHEVEVRIATYVKFFDVHGQLVAEVQGDDWKGDENLERAVRLEEEIVAISIIPL